MMPIVNRCRTSSPLDGGQDERSTLVRTPSLSGRSPRGSRRTGVVRHHPSLQTTLSTPPASVSDLSTHSSLQNSLSTPYPSTSSLPQPHPNTKLSCIQSASLPRRKRAPNSKETDHDSSFGSMSARSSSTTTDSASPVSDYRSMSSDFRGSAESPVSDIHRTDSHVRFLFYTLIQ